MTGPPVRSSHTYLLYRLLTSTHHRIPSNTSQFTYPSKAHRQPHHPILSSPTYSKLNLTSLKNSSNPFASPHFLASSLAISTSPSLPP